MKSVDEITQIIGQKFRSFGGGQENPYNPVSMALKDQPLQFAAGVSIKDVVRTVLYYSETERMLTKKDFKAVAGIIKASIDVTIIYSTTEPHTTIKGNIAKELANYFATQNPRFDRDRFMQACGLG